MLYSSGEKQMYVEFNASNTDKMNWFGHEKTTESSYTDLTPNRTYKYFSITG